jgi:hypothetical protein
MPHTRYELAKKDRPYEILYQLVKLANDGESELEKEIQTVVDLFFGRPPKGLLGEYQNTVDLQKEWRLLHVNNNWVRVKCEISSSEDLNPKNITFKNHITKETHIWTDFLWQYVQVRILIKRLASLGEKIDILDNNIANSEIINRFLLCDTLEFNEALFLLLGFNPVNKLTLTIDRHEYISIDFMFTGFIFNDGIEEYRLLNKGGWERIENDTTLFIEWASEKGFFVKPKPTHEKTIATDKNIKKVEKALLEYVPTLNKQANKNALAFHRDHDSFSQQFNFQRSTLLKYLTALITYKWWTNQEKDIQDNIKNPKK